MKPIDFWKYIENLFNNITNKPKIPDYLSFNEFIRINRLEPATNPTEEIIEKLSQKYFFIKITAVASCTNPIKLSK